MLFLLDWALARCQRLTPYTKSPGRNRQVGLPLFVEYLTTGLDVASLLVDLDG
jgi:hypothetical protein